MHGSGFRLTRRYSRVITLLALLTLWLGQSMAVAHTLRHVGKDAPGLPASHAQLCTECASLAPLLAVAGGSAGPVFAPAQCATTLAPPAPDTKPEQALHYAFRSRAPPR